VTGSFQIALVAALLYLLNFAVSNLMLAGMVDSGEAFFLIAATALMLVAMNERSFVVTIAYLKTEPIQVAIFGLIFLGDAVTWPMMAVVIGTVTVSPRNRRPKTATWIGSVLM